MEDALCSWLKDAGSLSDNARWSNQLSPPLRKNVCATRFVICRSSFSWAAHLPHRRLHRWPRRQSRMPLLRRCRPKLQCLVLRQYKRPRWLPVRGKRAWPRRSKTTKAPQQRPRYRLASQRQRAKRRSRPGRRRRRRSSCLWCRDRKSVAARAYPPVPPRCCDRCRATTGSMVPSRLI